uniref:DUF881 domain-containing protein n=1 Tax=Janibacter limosus TaxID=53458 RepID=A0AC61U830_9MICO|nr:DUF881 domain-containing protein [Janibacter limosus]
MIGVCTAQLRDRDGSRAAARADLIRQIEDRQGVVDERGVKVRTLQTEIDVATGQLDPDLVGTQRKDLEDRRVTSGPAAVQGPGVRLTPGRCPGSSNSADGDPRTGVSDEGRVRSSDMQVVTNALWQAGAEAITINGQRLTSRTAIRFAGEAIPGSTSARSPGRTPSRRSATPARCRPASPRGRAAHTSPACA